MNSRITSTIISILILFPISISIFCSPPAHMIKKGQTYHQTRNGKRNGIRDRIVRTAKRYLGVKYRYGGETLFGFDCSGFIKHIFDKHGLSLPRNARSQYTSGRKINLKNAKPGDLVFFRIDGNRISHVGLYLGNYRFIHSPSKGKKVSYASIKNSYWQKRYVGTATYL